MTPARRQILSLAAVTSLLVISECRRESAPADDRESEETADHEQRIELPPKALEGISLRTAVVSARPLADEIRATAEIKANEYRLAHVGPRIPGKAVEVSAVLGSRVSAGQTLALLDSLELGDRKSAFLQARTNLEVARRNYEREERLFKQQISSQKEYLEAKGEFERSDAAYKAAREALRLVGLSNRDIEEITWGTEGKDYPLSVFPLLAPFAGTLVVHHITIGVLF